MAIGLRHPGGLAATLCGDAGHIDQIAREEQIGERGDALIYSDRRLRNAWSDRVMASAEQGRRMDLGGGAAVRQRHSCC